MGNRIRVMKYGLCLSKNFIKASKAIKSDDETTHSKVLKKLSKDVLKAVNKKNIKVINQEIFNRLDGSIILSNHQDNLDIFLLINAIEQPIRFVAKKELFKIPFFQNYIKLSHSYSLDREDPRQGVKLFKQVVKDVNEQDKNVVIFPEGTRSASALMSEFNSGLFNIIKRSNKPIIPTYINDSYAFNDSVEVIFGNPILPETFQKYNPLDFKDAVYQEIITIKQKHINNSKKYNILGLGDSITFGEMYNQSYDKGYFYDFVKQMNDQGLINKSYNFSIPGSTIDDVNKLLELDNYNEIVKEAVYDNIDHEFLDVLLRQKDDTMANIIAQTDILLYTCGANDILSNVKGFKVSKEDQIIAFKEMQNKTANLFEKIITINPKIKIVMIGQYYPYPHIKSLLKYDNINILDSYLKELESKISNLYYISTYLEVFENKDSFLPDRKNIHLSEEGYRYLTNKVVKLFQSKLEDK